MGKSELHLDGSNRSIRLFGKDLVFAIDETGVENLSDANQAYFGFAGCGFMAEDYYRLVDAPYSYTCAKYFPELERPLHANDLKQRIRIVNDPRGKPRVITFG